MGWKLEFCWLWGWFVVVFVCSGRGLSWRCVCFIVVGFVEGEDIWLDDFGKCRKLNS